jgi:hypothetical protein
LLVVIGFSSQFGAHFCHIYVFYCGYVVFKNSYGGAVIFSPAKNRRSKDDFGVVCNKGFDSLTWRQAGAQPDNNFDSLTSRHAGAQPDIGFDPENL